MPLLLAAGIVIAVIAWMFFVRKEPLASQPETAQTTTQPKPPEASQEPTAAEKILEGYADPATPPIDDLRKIHRVTSGYFSVVKDASRFPIGGNADLAAALRGENPNREVFVRDGNPIFSGDGLIIDRWGSPVIVHPEGWKQIELRSAGPDKTAYTADDLVLAASGAASN
ncbi:hypothetical protein OKA04_06380 [Luteolibacter flavescens]|uniref:Type II secretion system protein GspC N-terminal domain-containing protein n=1 Tax=Luteolibacter flavescens TaxID=1859460 RepID=A0ABT3FL85_9BACT|nr:hypothetical protein [Luteolibacter flavescens]MCW1884351.1 hypothetical protein [Luteolibacter flavescens]